jgi:hypothetical protein
MKRDRLTAIVGSAAANRGYAFHTGEEHSIGGTVRVYPAAWLAPVAVAEHTGRREGETTLRIILHLMALPTGGAETESAWQTLEKEALSMVSEIAASPEVCSVGRVRCSPARGSLTVHGECSVALECDVTMWYYL